MDQNESLPACRREIPETSHNIHKLLLCLILRIITKKFRFDTSDFFAIKSVAYDASLEMAAYFSVTAKLIKSIYNVTLPQTLSFAPFSTKISNLNVQCKKKQNINKCRHVKIVCVYANRTTNLISLNHQHWQSTDSLLTAFSQKIMAVQFLEILKLWKPIKLCCCT